MERETGLEPATPSLEGSCSSQLSYSRPKFFEPSSMGPAAQRATVTELFVRLTARRLVERGGFEPPKA